MLLRFLKSVFRPGAPPAPLPQDEQSWDVRIRDLYLQDRFQEALQVYDGAVAAGFQPCEPQFDAAYRRALADTLTPPAPLRRRTRFQSLCAQLRTVQGLGGETAECGCFRGLSTHLMLQEMKRADPAFDGRGHHVFDSFEGLSEPGPRDRAGAGDAAHARLKPMCRKGWFAASLQEVRAGLAGFPGVAYHPGWIPQSFAGVPEHRYRFVHLDLDLHDPTLAALEYFYPRLLPGGAIVCDDYNWPGEREAIEAFCARHGAQVRPTPQGQAVLIR